MNAQKLPERLPCGMKQNKRYAVSSKVEGKDSPSDSPLASTCMLQHVHALARECVHTKHIHTTFVKIKIKEWI